MGGTPSSCQGGLGTVVKDAGWVALSWELSTLCAEAGPAKVLPQQLTGELLPLLLQPGLGARPRIPRGCRARAAAGLALCSRVSHGPSTPGFPWATITRPLPVSSLSESHCSVKGQPRSPLIKLPSCCTVQSV